MLDMDAPKLKAYPAEVVIAEQFQAMVHLGIGNSRMKDFFDIWILCQDQRFLMSRLRRALEATFERRCIPEPVIQAARTAIKAEQEWPPKGPWRRI
jgi:hypothetical protein